MVQRESGQRGPVKTTFRVWSLYSYLVHGPERESGGQTNKDDIFFRVWCLYSYLVDGPEKDREEEEGERILLRRSMFVVPQPWNNVLINQT
jgi:hypothetical protein